MKPRRSDEDSPWKEILGRYFEEFLAFFFPQAHAAIAWEKGHEFLDKELQKVVRDAELGKRLVDKLVKVHTHKGVEAWVLVLPEELETEFAQGVTEYEEAVKMPYVTSVERVGIKKGELRASREAVLEILRTRFGELPTSLISAVNAIANPVVLKKLLKLSITSPSPQAFEESLKT
jgi:hypothetical protein